MGKNISELQHRIRPRVSYVICLKVFFPVPFFLFGPVLEEMWARPRSGFGRDQSSTDR